MAEPARRAPTPDIEADIEDGPERLDDESGPWVHRWVALPNGGFELREFPLTPEYFLDPQIGDQMVQGSLHGETIRLLCGLIERSFTSRDDVFIASDVKMLWKDRDRRRPVPDVMVVRGIRDPKRDRESFDVGKEGVRPCLVIEVVSPKRADLRRTDKVDKVELYAKEGITEYLVLDPPRPKMNPGFQWTGYRLDEDGQDRKYRRIEPDAEGRILSETTGLKFGTSPDGQQVFVFEAATGERLLTPAEIQTENERLREEIARLKSSPRPAD
ncbi:MAG TPA: Uma2 family endonuclease [Thermoanaerobaculia bacterium]|nr:Uma2 family endonuclease [Thermoanaerobaculia bacterium]